MREEAKEKCFNWSTSHSDSIFYVSYLFHFLILRSTKAAINNAWKSSKFIKVGSHAKRFPHWLKSKPKRIPDSATVKDCHVFNKKKKSAKYFDFGL